MQYPESLSPSCPRTPITELEIVTQQFEMDLVDENIDIISDIKPRMVSDATAVKFAEYAASLWDPNFREDYDK